MRKLYPRASDQELEEGYKIVAYVDAAWRIAERIEKGESAKSSTSDSVCR